MTRRAKVSVDSDGPVLVKSTWHCKVLTMISFPFKLPTPSALMLGGLLAFIWSYCCLRFAGHLKTKIHLRTGYTRKVFHVLIFVSAVVVQAFGGFAAVCVFGMMVSLVVGLAVLRG